MENPAYYIDGEAAMVAFGERLGAALAAYPAALSLHLLGDLGAGKTTLTRGILRAFGHTGAVKSPTYTLVEEYDLGARRIYHFDLYRLGDPEELEYMGIRDYFAADNLCLIEWPTRGAGILPLPDLQIAIAPAEQGRRITLQAAEPLQGLLPKG